LHLVGILFPHINDDARSKSHQICKALFTPDIFIERCLRCTTQMCWCGCKVNGVPCAGRLSCRACADISMWHYPTPRPDNRCKSLNVPHVVSDQSDILSRFKNVRILYWQHRRMPLALFMSQFIVAEHTDTVVKILFNSILPLSHDRLAVWNGMVHRPLTFRSLKTYIYIYICRTAELTSRRYILNIQQIYILNILNMLHNLRFFLFKMPFIS